MKEHEIRLELAKLKERIERLICEMLDDPKYKKYDNGVIGAIGSLKLPNNKLIKECVAIAFIDLLYSRYTRILDELDENTGYSNLEIEDE